VIPILNIRIPIQYSRICDSKLKIYILFDNSAIRGFVIRIGTSHS